MHPPPTHPLPSTLTHTHLFFSFLNYRGNLSPLPPSFSYFSNHLPSAYPSPPVNTCPLSPLYLSRWQASTPTHPFHSSLFLLSSSSLYTKNNLCLILLLLGLDLVLGGSNKTACRVIKIKYETKDIRA